MSKNTTSVVRRAHPTGANAQGPTYEWRFTDAAKSDPVELRVQPMAVLPVVFVPGIMGSNLVTKGARNPDEARVWNVDDTWGALAGISRDAAQRQNELHFTRTEVYTRGLVPKEASRTGLRTQEDYWKRGWGEVGCMSYGEFLLWLERTLNEPAPGAPRQTLLMSQLTTALGPEASRTPQGWQAARAFDPLKPDELTQANRWLMPVYACGYNWLGDNSKAAQRLQKRIDEIITRHHDGKISFCKQVLLITHSMGGLVARACQALPGMSDKIAGVLHGVMPTVGAPVAYRRCKVGMMDEGASGMSAAAIAAWGGAKAIGESGQHVTPVFAQSPGALQLLPTQAHPPGWLRISGPNGADLQPPLPTANPYAEIYRERMRWWGLVREEWLRPRGGEFPMAFEDFRDEHLNAAEAFHSQLTIQTYHPNTYAFYGNGGQDEHGPIQSFEQVQWLVQPGSRPGAPPLQHVPNLRYGEVNVDGTNPEHVGMAVSNLSAESPALAMEVSPPPEWHWHYQMRAAPPEAGGDGTVNRRSGAAVGQGGSSIKQVFVLPGIAHEPAYKSLFVRRLVVYAVLKISAQASYPVPFTKAKAPAT